MKVAVIGGGLVGRLAAWAVMQSGHAPTIFDRMTTAKPPRGFVYLHDSCDLPLRRSHTITVINQGTAREYAEKIYGNPDHPVSFGKYEYENGFEPAEALGILNGLQHGMWKDANFESLEEIETQLGDEFERVVFTLPINRFVKGTWPHVKGSVGTWPLDPGEDLGNFCVYNSNPDIPWHRSGAMFGWAFREFPTVVPGHLPITKVAAGAAPLPKKEGWLFTGRFGAWRNKALSHDSYDEVLEWLV